MRDAFNSSLNDSLRKRKAEIRRLGENLRKTTQALQLAESRDHRITSEETNNVAHETNSIVRRTHHIFVGQAKHLLQMSEAHLALVQRNQTLEEEKAEFQKRLHALEHEKSVSYNMQQTLLDIFSTNTVLLNQTERQLKAPVKCLMSVTPGVTSPDAVVIDPEPKHFFRKDILDAS